MIATVTTQVSEAPPARAVFEGVLLGTAVGDALGLPLENLSPGRIARLWKGKWRMCFLFGRGMISDDTEHTLMVAQALLSHPDDVMAFQRTLAWKFRWWFASLPAGVGLATARACLKLWLGFPPGKSAVHSGGSGPAMRSAILGAYFAADAAKRREFVRASTRLTHRGWQAETAAMAVAECSALAASSSSPPDISRLLSTLRELSPEPDWHQCLSHIRAGLARKASVWDFAHVLGSENGVSGYALHVVPVAIYAWLFHQRDFKSALTAAIACGGDTDTVGAILGALCGASGGPGAIPREWVDDLIEWPRSVVFIRAVAQRLAEQTTSSHGLGGVRYFWPAVILRNLIFLVVVLLHGFRRLLPPY